MNEQQQEQDYLEGEFKEVPEDKGYTERGDSFDIGHGSRELAPRDTLNEILRNPKGLADMLNITPRQAENICSVIAGAGAGAGYKFLAKYIGGELASALGGFFGAYISNRVIRK